MTASGAKATGPYRTTTTAMVMKKGIIAAATARMIDDETHFDSQIEPRDTGFEETQARVPVSRSWTIRLATAKIAAIRKICEPGADSRFSIGSSDGNGMFSVPGSGKL